MNKCVALALNIFPNSLQEKCMTWRNGGNTIDWGTQKLIPLWMMKSMLRETRENAIPALNELQLFQYFLLAN